MCFCQLPLQASFQRLLDVEDGDLITAEAPADVFLLLHQDLQSSQSYAMPWVYAAAANEALRKALVRFRIPAEATVTVKTQDNEREKQEYAGVI